MAEYYAPWKAEFITQNQDPKRTSKMFSSKPVSLLSQSVAKIHNSLIGPTTDWFSFELDDEDLMQYRPVSKFFEWAERAIYRILNRTNFDAESFTTYYDILLFGTGGMYRYQPDELLRPGQYNFKCRPLTGLYIIENEAGLVDTQFFQYRLSAYDINKNYPEAAEQSEKLATQLSKNPYEKMNMLHVVAPKDDDQTYNPNHQFISLQILLDEKLLLNGVGAYNRGFHENPYVVVRGFRLDDTAYGYSQSTIALPDVKTKNKLWELFLKALAKDVDPPLLAQHDSIMGRIKQAPNTINWINPKTKPADALVQMTSSRRMDTVQFADASINQNMGDMFQEKFSFSAQRSGPNMSAREVNAIESDKNEMLAPVLGRHNYEFVGPQIMGIFNDMMRTNYNGIRERVPPELRNHTMHVKAVGPLFNSQQMRKVFAMEDLMLYAQQMAGTNPNMAKSLDEDFIMREMARIKDAPASAIKSEKELQQEIAAEQQQQQMQQALEMAETGASAIGKAGLNRG